MKEESKSAHLEEYKKNRRFESIPAYEELRERQDQKPIVRGLKRQPRSYPKARRMIPPSRLISLVSAEHGSHGFCRIIPLTDLCLTDYYLQRQPHAED